jgi:hypothetical protein
MNIRTAFPPAVAGAACAAPLLALGLILAGPASAGTHPRETMACDAAATSACAGLVDQALVPNLALSADSGTPVPGSRVITGEPADSRRQDFIVKAPFGDGSVTVIRWAPRGVPSNLCVTGHTPNGSLATFTRCRGLTRQQFTEVPGADGAFVLVNKATGLALRISAVTGEVFNKDPGLGTGLNEQFSLRTAL